MVTATRFAWVLAKQGALGEAHALLRRAVDALTTQCTSVRIADWTPGTAIACAQAEEGLAAVLEELERDAQWVETDDGGWRKQRMVIEAKG